MELYIIQLLSHTRKVSAGIGVEVSTLRNAKHFGKCPFLAPASGSLEGANMALFNAPNIELKFQTYFVSKCIRFCLFANTQLSPEFYHATKIGIIQDIIPSTLSPKV